MELSSEVIELFTVIIAGIIYGWYCYNQGKKCGWDDAMYSLEEIGFLQVNDEGEVCRITDKEYNETQKLLKVPEKY